MGKNLLPRQQHQSGMFKVDSDCGARGPWFESRGEPLITTTILWRWSRHEEEVGG